MDLPEAHSKAIHKKTCQIFISKKMKGRKQKLTKKKTEIKYRWKRKEI